MYFPAFYLEKISNLTNQSGFLYHWTKVERVRQIINDKFLYSKATLFGMHPTLCTMLSQHPDLLADTENGFIDYVFLGNTNWVESGLKPYYGQICFELKPFPLLKEKEFYVFPFNTGRAFKSALEEDKYSDLTTLKDALNKKSKSYEVLVRGKIEICADNVNRIISDCSNIREIGIILNNNQLSHIPVEEY
ncbi:hypothetical protein B1207_07530 [Legionella quinlivanii]|uniref:DarT domain-containing protein n=2 Tax=Legionella quinlivanii TaxID=45073 RepID=A0A364LJD7_9GAMM|nr:hypothetical protein B1207_07530 [Legionella quinlivanii]